MMSNSLFCKDMTDPDVCAINDRFCTIVSESYSCKRFHATSAITD